MAVNKFSNWPIFVLYFLHYCTVKNWNFFHSATQHLPTLFLRKLSYIVKQKPFLWEMCAALGDCYSLTFTLVSHCLTAVKLGSSVMSYITTTPSALRKNCLVMLRYLQEEVNRKRKCYAFNDTSKIPENSLLALLYCATCKNTGIMFSNENLRGMCFVCWCLTSLVLLYPTSAVPPGCCPQL